MITSVDLPAQAFTTHYTYLKLRDRASYAFALVSVAVALELDGTTIQPGPACARRRGAQAVARQQRRSLSEGQDRPSKPPSRMRPTRCSATRGAMSTTPSRSILRAGPSSVRWARPRPAPPRSKPTSGSSDMTIHSRHRRHVPVSASRVRSRSRARPNMPASSRPSISPTAMWCPARSRRDRITSIDIRAAKDVPGVLAVYTHKNRPKVADDPKSYQDQVSPPGDPLRPLHDEVIYHSGQPIALVVAEDFEIARYAASLVRGHLRGRDCDHRPQRAASAVLCPETQAGRLHAAGELLAGTRRRRSTRPSTRWRPNTR